MPSIESIYEIFLQSGEVTTDSRKCKPGCLFFALKGDRFDGNQYAAAALKAGAGAAVVDDPSVVEGDDSYVLVDDVLGTMQQLSTYHRSRFNIPVLAITGSNGKTTTKNLIARVLESHYRCHYTRGNLNNHIGVPLTLLRMPQTTEVAVIEMGANHVGEIAVLCEIARPTHGLITNIGKAHLEGFGGLEGVKKGKGELYDFLAKTSGVAFVNKAEDHLTEMARHVGKKIFYDNRKLDLAHPDFLVQLEASTPFVNVVFHDRRGQEVQVESRLFGDYNFQNISTAISIGKYFRVPARKIKVAVESFDPDNNRSQVIEYQGASIIMDAYNANPTSMRNALLYFAALPGQPKLVILGDMLELGPYSEAEHLAIGELLQSLNLDEVALVGPFFRDVAQKFGFKHVVSVDELGDWWSTRTLSGARVLFKGSRGMQLEKLVE